jgi:hypothetical protein
LAKDLIDGVRAKAIEQEGKRHIEDEEEEQLLI